MKDTKIVYYSIGSLGLLLCTVGLVRPTVGPRVGPNGPWAGSGALPKAHCGNPF